MKEGQREEGGKKGELELEGVSKGIQQLHKNGLHHKA